MCAVVEAGGAAGWRRRGRGVLFEVAAEVRGGGATGSVGMAWCCCCEKIASLAEGREARHLLALRVQGIKEAGLLLVFLSDNLSYCAVLFGRGR